MIYLDYHATTPVDRCVVDRIYHFMTTEFGNASSTDHEWGDREFQQNNLASLHSNQPVKIQSNPKHCPVSHARITGSSMTYTPTQLLTVDQFIAQYGDDYRYELADGELIDMEPTGPHEAVGGKIASQIGIAIAQQQLPWFIPRTCLIQPSSEIATARRPDVVVLDKTMLSSEPHWEYEPVITLGRSIKLVVEVVSTNWETDYARKVEEYALLGIPEYWIADYRGLGGIAFIGKPKQPTLTVCQLQGEEYRQQQYRLGQSIYSPLLTNLELRLDDILPR